MQLHQLQYFVAVADELSVTRAAARLRVAQPGVSAQIRKLERELGHPLLDRSGRGVTLTAVGVEVLPVARAALTAVAAVAQVVDDLAGLVRGRVAVGAVSATAVLDLPAVLADFRSAHTDVEITLTEGGSAALLADLRSGLLDVAVVGITGPDPHELHVDTLSQEPLVLAVAPGDPLTGPVTVADLADRVFVAPPAGNALRDALDLTFPGAHIAFEASDPAVVARMVGRGLGVALLPASLGALRSGALHVVALAAPVPPTRLGLVSRHSPPPSPAARALIRRMLSSLHPPSAGRPATLEA